MSRVLEEAFIRSRIQYQVVRGVEFYNRKEIRDMLAYLKVIANPDDEIALLRIINTPTRGIGKVTVDRLRIYASNNRVTLFEAVKKAENIESLSRNAKARLATFADMFRRFAKANAGPVGPLAETVFEESGLAASLVAAGADGKDACDNVDELINAATEYDKQAQEPSLIDYLQHISLFSDTDAYDPTTGRVALMTLHAAKGLEFENVFILGVEEGLLPHERTNSHEDQDELEEERRLLFVGITRAKSNLNISYARYRTIRGQSLRTIPSQFLFELGCDFDEQDYHEDDYDSDDEDDERFTIAEPGPRFAVGQLVRHHSFGLGRVQEFVDVGENSTVTVKFNTGQVKSLMLKYAGLVKM